ncbi:MAG TPA: M28 family peptidase [Blastocatellia bacterium]|nr:M28 family peptidase [Blastocatellia bacterium]
MGYNRSLKQVLASLVIACMVAASPVLGGNLPPLPPDEATASITVVDLKKHLSFLASDELGGRYTLSPSNRIAARYLASQLESYGYRGAARDGSFFQQVPLRYSSVDFGKSKLVINAGGVKQEFKYADDYNVTPPASVDFSGEMVFVGYGISSPAHGHDDYAGLDVKGKIIVAVSGMPASLSRAAVSLTERGEQAAITRGAAGAIIIPAPNTLMVWDQLKDSMSREQQIGLPPRRTPRADEFPSILAGPRMIKAIAKLLGRDDDLLISPKGKPLQTAVIPASADVKVSVSAKSAGPAQNVVGVLEGADSKLKDEYVVFSAHYDHLASEATGDVYNGADDDGSGTSAVLEIAQAFALGARSARSVLIIFHTGEEMGLFGSEFNTDYEPVVPLKKLVADFNIDMIGRSRAGDNIDSRDRMLTDKNSIYIIGADKLSTELHQINEQTNSETAKMKFDYTYNRDNHPERFYYRSDHYNYAKHGIPVIFYFTGVHRDYHRTTDDVDKIDFEKMQRIARMVLATGWRVANLDHRLVVDKKPTL